MASTLQEIFHHIHIGELVSEIRKPMHKLCNTYGLMPGDRNVNQVGGRDTAWDVFDSTREVAGISAPESPAQARAPHPVGHRQARLIRTYDRYPVSMGRLHRNRGLGQPLGTVDVMGERWVEKQIENQVEKCGNLRELMTALMLRDGAFDILMDGMEMHIAPTGSGSLTVDFQHPASHEGNVPKIIGGGNVFSGAWQTVTTNIHQELLDLVAHAEQSSRLPITQAWIDSECAGYLLQNESLRNVAGTANIVFADGNTLNYTGDQNLDGKMVGHMHFTLRAFPQIKWNVYNSHVILSDGTLTKFVGGGKAIFTPDPTDHWIEMHEGSEPVKRDYRTDMTEEYGMTMWIRENLDPAGFNMYVLDNVLPVGIVPTAWYSATVHA